MRRGLETPELALPFLTPQLKTLGDPFALPDMAAAVERLFAALDRRERIVLYGDYDVDGVTSLALLKRLLDAYGGEVACFLPLRLEEGYGLSREGVDRCVAEHNPQLLVALDCGTASAGEIARLATSGVEAVVVDHHECPAGLPRCAALVNPKRPGAGEAHRHLCTAGLVFKLCHALLKTRPLEAFDLRECLDLVALGTVADLAPLTGENRILVTRGLRQLAKSRWPGVRALVEAAGAQAPFTAGDVGFYLGPRLNAAGRLGVARDALELLLTADPARARALASALDALNRERQEVERRAAEEAQAQAVFDPARDAAVVVGSEGWHPGVVGIVASRLAKKFHRPALVVGFDESGRGRGSGRSIEGFSLVRALEACAPFLEQFGGHEMAAGLTVRRDRFEAFREAFGAAARAGLPDEALRPKVRLDAELSLEWADFPFLDLHDRLHPFGIGNPQPLFFARGVRPMGEPRVLKEKHLRLSLGQGGVCREAIFFNAPVGALPRPPWDVAFRLARNQWRGRETVEIQVQALRTSPA